MYLILYLTSLNNKAALEFKSSVKTEKKTAAVYAIAAKISFLTYLTFYQLDRKWKYQ